VLSALQDLQEKTELAQAEARKKEKTERHNFDLMKQSFETKIAAHNKDLEGTKKALARAKEVRATSERELQTCKADLAEDKKVLDTTKRDCMERASQFEDKTKTRAKELDALAKSKKIIQDSSSGAGKQAYSFLQMRRRQVTSASMAAANRALRQLHHLARSTDSLALSQLASQASVTIRSAGEGTYAGAADPFVKVRGMIESMIRKLEQEHKEEANKKAFCDKEVSQTSKSKEDKSDQVEELTGRLESIAADVAKLQEDLKTLAEAMAQTARSQAEMDHIRREEHTTYTKTKADVQEGLAGVQRALSILRDYYGGGSSSGETSFVQEAATTDEEGTSLLQEDEAESMAAVASGEQQQRAQQRTQARINAKGAGKSIIGLLEVVESDFATELTEIQTTEQAATEEHAKLTEENKIMVAKQDAEVKNKQDEVTKLRKTAAELTSDRTESQQELDAINEYWKQLESQCGPKKESYLDRAARRKREIQGLKDAMAELESANN